MNIVNLNIGKLNLCYVAYILMGGDREKETDRDGERERESTLQDHVIFNKMSIALCGETQ